MTRVRVHTAAGARLHCSRSSLAPFSRRFSTGFGPSCFHQFNDKEDQECELSGVQ